MRKRFAPLVPLMLTLLATGCAVPHAQHIAATDDGAVAANPTMPQSRAKTTRTSDDYRQLRNAFEQAPEAEEDFSSITDATPYALPVLADSILERGFELVGTPYRYGGGSTKTGFDCSGFINYLFREEAGMQLPRSTREMIKFEAPVVARADLKPGDVLFFNNRGRGRVSHAGIYIGDDQFIHSASKRGGGVRIDSLDEAYWRASYMEAKRILALAPTQQSLVRAR